ncbi:MAG: PAS domain-containing sensor histidine kinase [Gaiellaceae bacterium]
MSRLTLGLGLALLLVEASVAVALVATSDHVTDKGWTLGFAVTAGVAFVVSGLVAIVRRPENRTGVYLAAVGYLWFVGALTDSDNPWLFPIGIIVSGLTFVPFSALLLAHPTGRFDTRLERAFPLVVGVVLVSLATAIVLVDSSPLPECETCPENAMLVVDSPGVADVLQTAATGAAIALALAGTALLIGRWRRATPVLRRALLPVFVAGGAVLVGLVVEALLAELVSADAADAFTPVLFAVFAAVPLAFLFGILQTRLARSSVAEVVLALQAGTPLRVALADALRDPSLELVYRLDRSSGLGGTVWVDPEGRTVGGPSPDTDRAVNLIEQDGETLAAVTYEASLAEQPELVDAVVAAAGLAIRNERLQAELRAEVRLAGTLADTAPSLLSNVDTDGRILKLNHATLRASGYEDEADVRGKYFWDVFIDEAEREAMTGRFAAAAPDYPPTEYENTFTNLRGERLVIYWRSTPVVDEHGKVVSIVAAGLDITERHRLEAEKEREREFLNAIANNAPSLICLIDDEGRVTDQGANMAFERTLERDPSDIGGEIFWMRYVHPGDADEVRERIERVVAGEALGEHDNYWVTGTGRRLLMAWTCTPLPALDERRLFLITGVDVTERNRRESEVHEARDFLQTVVSTIPSLLVIVDSEALIVENGVNRAFTDTFGWSGWESTGRSFLELVHPEDEYAVRMAIAAAANGVPRTDLEARWLRQAGDAAIVAWTATPNLDAEGRTRVLLSGMDVTERKRREEEIRASEERFRAVIERAPAAILEIDLDLRVKLWNPAAERIFGWASDEILGIPVPIVPPEQEDEFIGMIDEIREGRAVTGVETVRLRRDGSRVNVEVSAAPIRDASGVVAGYMAVFSDISERKRHEEELRASRARLVAAGDDARRKLERNLHDGAQQRLVALSVSLRLAESKLAEDPAGTARILAGAREELMHALEELRELARGIHPAVLTDRGLAPAIEALVGRTPLPVVVDIVEGRLPPAVEAASYYVVAEALTNVAKYAGASTARVHVGRENGRVTIEVADDGAGGADPARGSGLRGLADRVAALDGTLSVESPEGRGTAVRAEIPLVEAVEE